MASTVNAARRALHEQYVRLRLKIFDHYGRLALVGSLPGAAAQRLPPKLGHWTERHSALVRAVSVELEPIVAQIERLRAGRDPERIKAQHTPLRRGDNFRRKRSDRPKVQLNPGEWPPKWRKW
jgi:hypothetical protein